MFQFTSVKAILLLLFTVSMVIFWYLDTSYYHWDRALSEPQTRDLVVDLPSPPPTTVNDTFKSKDFVPTDQWQIIEKDQAIPPGLHVQINLQTGVKRAKLLEDDKNDKTHSLAIMPSNNSENNEELKSIPENVHKFKSYQNLKNDLKDLNMTVKTDMEIMNDLSKKFQEQIKIYEDSDDYIKNILTDLEYLLHQVDTAEAFVKNQGIESIIIPCINSNSSFMKAQGALLLGSAASNNPKVQIVAYKTNIIPILLEHIDEKYEFAVQKNCFYALSTIIRRFPLAQNQFIEKNGIQILMSVFLRYKSDSNIKLKVRIAQLLEDLVIETEDAKLTLQEETNEQLNSEAKERLRQYNELHLKEKLVENEWCEILCNEFITLSDSLPTNEEGHDMVEASGKSLLLMSKLCRAKLHGNEKLFKSFSTLESYYQKLFKQDNFFNPLYHLVNELSNTYNPVLE